METLIANVNWISILLGAFLAFALGSVWFSPKMFGTKWREGLGAQAVQGRSLGMILIPQAIATFLLALLLNITADTSLALALLVALTVAIFIKTNGLFAGHTKYTISTDTLYIIAQAVIILVIYYIFR